MTKEKIIVTFCCNPAIHVFKKGSRELPRPPFKSHLTVEAAQEYMKTERGIANPIIFINS
jgi:hypothetical protein